MRFRRSSAKDGLLSKKAKNVAHSAALGMERICSRYVSSWFWRLETTSLNTCQQGYMETIMLKHYVFMLEKSFLPGNGGSSGPVNCALSWSCSASNSRKRRLT